ncbi:protein FAM107B-like isoform X4, partial [Lates japonicus]
MCVPEYYGKGDDEMLWYRYLGMGILGCQAARQWGEDEEGGGPRLLGKRRSAGEKRKAGRQEDWTVNLLPQTNRAGRGRMGAAYGKKKAYSIDHEPPPKQQCVKNGKLPNGRASAYADLQQHRSEGIHRKPSPVSSYVPPPDYLDENEDDDLIKPKKLVNPVKASKSHQELHRELMSSYK